MSWYDVCSKRQTKIRHFFCTFVLHYSKYMARKRKGKKKDNFASSIYKKTGTIILLIIVTGCCWYISRNREVLYPENKSEITYTGGRILTHIPDAEIPARLKDRKEQIIRHKGYTVSYNNQLRLPNWVAYELLRNEVNGSEERSGRFEIDPGVIGTCPTYRDYSQSGYDRGHMAPAGDAKWNSQAMKESFYMTNICPQKPGLNRGNWKELEEQIREWAILDSALLIVCGPVVTDKSKNKTIGKNKVTIPERFFKVIVAPYLEKPRGIGFLFTNDDKNRRLQDYVVTIDSIEYITGIDFFPALPDEAETLVEGYSNPGIWNLR